MKRILVALSMAATFVLAGTDLGYAQEDHIAQAREHASAAVEHGKMGHADVATGSVLILLGYNFKEAGD